MARQDVDGYLAGLSEPQRGTLEHLRQGILDLLAGAEEGVSYGMPAFRIHGQVVSGFAAFKDHLSYFPHSGSVLPALRGTGPGSTSQRFSRGTGSG